MQLILSLAVIGVTILGSEWLVGSWLGEDRRTWVGLAGVAILFLSGALVKASGINELTRVLRNAVVGAGIGAALTRAGLRLGWLRRGLRVIGIETEPKERPPEAPRWSRLSEGLLMLGAAGSLVGGGMIWTGLFAG